MTAAAHTPLEAELLEALEMVMLVPLAWQRLTTKETDMIRAAIAKAKGSQHG